MDSQTSGEAWAQIVATAGPPALALAMEILREARTNQPEIITPAQWDELRQMFAEPYDQRKERIRAAMQAAGQL